jgi:hypothetical protein
MTPRETILDLKARMGRSIIGQEAIIERLLIGLLANGNLLVEGLPGLAKTRAVKSLAENLDAGLSRIQFTPDLLPSDITGTGVYYQADGGKGEFRLQQGPIFNNLYGARRLQARRRSITQRDGVAPIPRHDGTHGRVHRRVRPHPRGRGLRSGGGRAHGRCGDGRAVPGRPPVERDARRDGGALNRDACDRVPTSAAGSGSGSGLSVGAPSIVGTSGLAV